MPLNLTAHFSKQSGQTVPHINRTIFKAVNYDLTSPRSTVFFLLSVLLHRKKLNKYGLPYLIIVNYPLQRYTY